MTSAMGELFSEPCACNYATRHVVDFCTANWFTSANIFAHEIDGRIAGFPHNVENARVLFRNSFADITGPGLVSRDCFRFVELSGRIDQDEIAAPDRRVLFLYRHVVWICGGCGYRHDHRLLLPSLIPVAVGEELRAVSLS